MDTLTREQQIKTLSAIKSGATIYSLNLAQEVRKIQKETPEYILIYSVGELETMFDIQYNPDKLPYFGAALTQQGKEHLKQLKKERKQCYRDLCKTAIRTAKQ